MRTGNIRSILTASGLLRASTLNVRALRCLMSITLVGCTWAIARFAATQQMHLSMTLAPSPHMSDEQLKLPVLRCDVTENPYGTDTRPEGQPCLCPPCQAADAIERLQAELAEAQSKLFDVEELLGVSENQVNALQQERAAFGDWRNERDEARAREERKDTALTGARPFLGTLTGMVPTQVAKDNIGRHIKMIDQALAAPGPDAQEQMMDCYQFGTVEPTSEAERQVVGISTSLRDPVRTLNVHFRNPVTDEDRKAVISALVALAAHQQGEPG